MGRPLTSCKRELWNTSNKPSKPVIYVCVYRHGPCLSSSRVIRTACHQVCCLPLAVLLLLATAILVLFYTPVPQYAQEAPGHLRCLRGKASLTCFFPFDCWRSAFGKLGLLTTCGPSCVPICCLAQVLFRCLAPCVPSQNHVDRWACECLGRVCAREGAFQKGPTLASVSDPHGSQE